MADDVKVPEGFKKMEASPTWNYQENPTFRGVFISAEGDVGPNHSNLYTFKTEDGSLMAVWGNSILDVRFKNLQLGEEVFIHYLGKVKSEKIKGREYHNFEVYHNLPDVNKEAAETFSKTD